MAKATLIYGDLGGSCHEEHPETADDLIMRLEQLRDYYNPRIGMPYAVDVVHDGIGILSVGLGNGQWILMYQSDHSACKMSRGDFCPEDDYPFSEDYVEFYFGDVSALSRKYLVPKENVLKAVRQWFDLATLSDAIEWTEELF